ANAANCVKIVGATAGTYTVVDADIGHVIEGAIFGTNVWGGNGWGLAYDSAVVTAAGGGRGGGGGGGGGGVSVPDLGVSIGAKTTSLQPGGDDELTVYVKNAGGAGSLQTHLSIVLPTGITLLGPPAVERGSGCTGTPIDCNLDYIPNGETTKV